MMLDMCLSETAATITYDEQISGDVCVGTEDATLIVLQVTVRFQTVDIMMRINTIMHCCAPTNVTHRYTVSHV